MVWKVDWSVAQNKSRYLGVGSQISVSNHFELFHSKASAERKINDLRCAARTLCAEGFVDATMIEIEVKP